MSVSTGYLPVLYPFNRFYSLAIVKFVFENIKILFMKKMFFPVLVTGILLSVVSLSTNAQVIVRTAVPFHPLVRPAVLVHPAIVVRPIVRPAVVVRPAFRPPVVVVRRPPIVTLVRPVRPVIVYR